MNLLELCKPGKKTKIAIPVPNAQGLQAYLIRGSKPIP